MGARAAAIGARIRKHIAQAAIMLALEILRELKRNTPIDTGHARRNWVASVGSPNTIEITSEGDGGVSAVLSFKLSDGVMWISNVVDYVVFLNYGSSDQEPAGWIERSVDVAFVKTKEKLARAGKTDFDIDGLHAQYQGGVGGGAADNLADAYSPFGGD